MSSEKQLFKFHLDKLEKSHNTKPQFFYRINRHKLTTVLMRPISFFAPRYSFNGWLSKGAAFYIVFFVLFKREPFTKHWNRQGYQYERAIKSPFYNF